VGASSMRNPSAASASQTVSNRGPEPDQTHHHGYTGFVNLKPLVDFCRTLPHTVEDVSALYGPGALGVALVDTDGVSVEELKALISRSRQLVVAERGGQVSHKCGFDSSYRVVGRVRRSSIAATISSITTSFP
jgi:hypothetical protein